MDRLRKFIDDMDDDELVIETRNAALECNIYYKGLILELCRRFEKSNLSKLK